MKVVGLHGFPYMQILQVAKEKHLYKKTLDCQLHGAMRCPAESKNNGNPGLVTVPASF